MLGDRAVCLVLGQFVEPPVAVSTGAHHAKAEKDQHHRRDWPEPTGHDGEQAEYSGGDADESDRHSQLWNRSYSRSSAIISNRSAIRSELPWC